MLLSGALVAPAAAAPTATALRPPALTRPADGATVESLGAFSWRRDARALRYQFQVAADADFNSLVSGSGHGSLETYNTAATIARALPDGDYFWRVRSIGRDERAGRWSTARVVHKRWRSAPLLSAPKLDAPIQFPASPAVLSWSRVPNAVHYEVLISTDPELGSIALPKNGKPIETSGTSLALPTPLAPGRYSWAVVPKDARDNRGTRSAVGSFTWSWPTGTATRLTDVNDAPGVFDPQLSWDLVAGAVSYEVEINSSQDFAPGSRVCCADRVISTSLTPTHTLVNNTYYWRVRALDADGNAGTWNVGPSFQKDFDAVAPSIPNLHMRDTLSDPAIDLLPGDAFETSTPVVVWDPVPGAASYEVEVAPVELGACNWTTSRADRWNVTTATTAWTPLAPSWNTKLPGGVSFPTASFDLLRQLDPYRTGTTYCVRVLARADRSAKGEEVVSDWTQLGGPGGEAFTYYQQPLLPPEGGLSTRAEDYRTPQTGTLTKAMPLFTWNPVPFAQSYFVVVARDAAFTDVVDVALTVVPAYAPRTRASARTYPDETTSYYWAVLPASHPNGDGVSTQPQENYPQRFDKRSSPPAPISPASSATIAGQPTFRWAAAQGARTYRLEVSTDPGFGDLLDDVTTVSTAYTSSSTYPADSVLYWRVRANDENGVGLAWSPVSSFQRTIGTPAPSASNPRGGDGIPLLSWTPVPGAVGYDVHVDQADGTTRDFTTATAAFTPTKFYGTGVWHWQARARFPRTGGAPTPGPYFSTQAYTRSIAPPSRPRSVGGRHRALLSWAPTASAKQYRVEIAMTSSFGSVIDQATVDGTSYAPTLQRPSLLGGGTFFWRVAAVDEGGLARSGWVTARFTLARRMRIVVLGTLVRGRAGTVAVRAIDGRGRPVRGARVRVRGSKRPAARTDAEGVARLHVGPRRGGTLVVSVTKRGYDRGRGSIAVR